MRRSLYVGAAVVALPGLLAFHVPYSPAAHFVGAKNHRWHAYTLGGGGTGGVGGIGQHTDVDRLRARAGCCTRSLPSDLAVSAGNGDISEATSPPPPQNKNIPHTCLVLRDESTGCDIYLVGCLHGSQASGRDVQDVLEKVRPGAVVLELCESRHQGLRKDLEKAKVDVPLEGKERWVSAFRSWAKGVQNTSNKFGPLQGLLAGLLSAPYMVQDLGDLDPGLEFKTAMVYADASKRPNTSNRAGAAAAAAVGGAGPGECAVVLGDRDVQETLRRLGGALTALTGLQGAENKQQGSGDGSRGVGQGAKARARVSSGSRERDDLGAGVSGSLLGSTSEDVGELKAKAEDTSTWDWRLLASDARVLRVAVLGPSGKRWPDSLNVLDTLWRERQTLAILLLPLLLPLLLVMTVVLETLQRSIGGAATTVVAESVAAIYGGGARGFGALGGVGGGGAGTAGVGGNGAAVDLEHVLEGPHLAFDVLFAMFSVWFMLRFFRLLIKERDDVLAGNVMKACRDHPGRPVVAVLGLLHCNGVADLIRNSTGSGGVVRADREEEM